MKLVHREASLPPECQVPEEYAHRCGWCRKMGVPPHSGCNHNHASRCYDGEGKVECICGLAESLALYTERVAERAPEFGPEEA